MHTLLKADDIEAPIECLSDRTVSYLVRDCDRHSFPGENDLDSSGCATYSTAIR